MYEPRIDFAASPGAAPWWTWPLLSLGVLAAAWTGIEAHLARQEVEQARTRLHALQTILQARRPAPRRDAAAEAAAAQRAAARRSLELPWGGFLSTLQRTRPDDIALLALEADARQGRFDLTAEARGPAEMVAYFETLAATPGLAEVSLAQHDYREDGQARPVRFVLRGRWLAATAGGRP